MNNNTHPSLVVASLALAACTGSSGPSGPSISVKVAPMNLPGISDVCYDLVVLNGQPTPDDDDLDNEPEIVWSKPAICSGTYGNGPGGDITYIGPCDADVGQNNYVQLTLADVYAGAATPLLDQLDAAPDGDADYQNPCPTGDPCMLDFACRENEDQLVVFNLTIVRDANQGFFDIAVNFEDIFCSAKLDCRYATGPIELLHRPDGSRGQTAVVALACTTGSGQVADTVLHLNPIEVTCGDGTSLSLDPTIGPGNAWTETSPDPDPADAIWQVATYRGVEALPCATDSCNKLYWNIALGFDPAVGGCRVTTSATASTHAEMGSGLTPTPATYPWIGFAVDLTAPSGGLLCDQNALNITDSGVQTHYTPVGTPKRFCHSFDGVTVTSIDVADCRVRATVCGDGTVDATEACDPGAFDPPTGCDAGCTASCSETCALICECPSATCGDGVLDPGEDCDPNKDTPNNPTCTELGFAGGTLSCSEDCVAQGCWMTQPAVCGNSIVESGEQCDNGKDTPNNPTCSSLGYLGGTLTCQADCQANATGCYATCPGAGPGPDPNDAWFTPAVPPDGDGCHLYLDETVEFTPLELGTLYASFDNDGNGVPLTLGDGSTATGFRVPAGAAWSNDAAGGLSPYGDGDGFVYQVVWNDGYVVEGDTRDCLGVADLTAYFAAHPTRVLEFRRSGLVGMPHSGILLEDSTGQRTRWSETTDGEFIDYSTNTTLASVPIDSNTRGAWICISVDPTLGAWGSPSTPTYLIGLFPTELSAFPAAAPQ